MIPRLLLLAVCAVVLVAPLRAQSGEAACRATVQANADTLGRLQLPGAELYPTQTRSRARLIEAARVSCAPPRVDTLTVRVIVVDTLQVLRVDTVEVVRVDTVYVPALPDSVLEPPPAVPESVTVSFDYTTTTLWPSGSIGALPGGTGVLCASVLVDGVLHLGDRAVTATIITQDSVAFFERPEREGSGLKALCDAPASANGFEIRKSTPIYPVQWTFARVSFASLPVTLPVAEAVIP